MGMSSNGLFPYDEIAEGAVKGLLSWTKEQVLSFVNKLKNRDIAFIKNRETIDIVREQIRTAEWQVYKNYLSDKRLRLLVQMGLALRRMEKRSDKEMLFNLRDKIVFKYGADGLHIAQFVQNDFLGKYFAKMITEGASTSDLIRYIEEILNNVEKYVAFIGEKENPDKKVQEIKIRIQANLPQVFILASYGSAVEIVKKIRTTLSNEIQGYSVSVYEEGEKYVCLLTRIITI